ncbi:MAG: YbhB/YbcL family Raf kinase inhibitor-like protein [Alphaproteobacteria bacterium]|nr:YbhB/YbcL family Raf kinase inhibitor-like protein [Alphaproteobacteria bacterium]
MKKITAFIGAIAVAHGASAMELKSSSFGDNEFIPVEYVDTHCAGENISPELRWSGAPKGTKSFALVMHDPDAPHEHGWYHWIVIDIPPSVAGIGRGAKFSPPARELANNSGARGYSGPCPPINGGVHHYHFMVFALQAETVSFDEEMLPHEIAKLIRDLAIDGAKLTGLYEVVER